MRRTLIITAAALAVLGAGAAAIGLSRPAPSAPPPAARAIVLAPPTPPTGDPAALEAATRTRPQDAATWIALGDHRLAARDFAQAIRAYDKGLALDPNRSETWSALGEAHIQSERSTSAKMPPAARAAFDRALALDPDDLRANFYATMERDFMGEHDQAIGEWLAMLRRAPMGSDADEAIRTAIAASVNRNLGQVKRAMAEATRAQPRAVPAASTR